MGIIRRIKKILYGHEKYARSLGVKIGQNCRIASASWGSEPYLIEIGDHVHITAGVSFITHDGSVWVFREEIPDFDVFGRIKIGNNAYIGNNTMIMPGVTIGANCIIGASSIVTKSIPDNTVAAGNPARYICSTEEYRQRMLALNFKTKGLSEREKKNHLLSRPSEKFMTKKDLSH